MLVTERLRQSKAWDAEWDLPTFKATNDNPWIYMAYADLVIQLAGEHPLLRSSVGRRFVACEIEPGLFTRWPGKRGFTSHDEIMGAAYFDEWIARQILSYLDRTGGEYNADERRNEGRLSLNVYRFPWLRPYLLACAGFGVPIWGQLVWAAHMLYSAFTNGGPDNAGGRLRNWLMAHHMRHYPICAAAIWVWKRRLGKESDGLKESLLIEPREVPELGWNAPYFWCWP
jgi:hypothetical protein